MASTFKIGTTSGGVTALDALTTPLPDPQWEFQEYRKMERLDNLGVKGRGPQTVTWQFPILEVDQIAQLEIFKLDVPVYIQSLKRDDLSAVFEVRANWIDPRQDGDHRPGFRGYRMGFLIEFIVISEVP